MTWQVFQVKSLLQVKFPIDKHNDLENTCMAEQFAGLPSTLM